MSQTARGLRKQSPAPLEAEMKTLITILAVACLAGCGKMSEQIDQAIAKAIPNGEILILTSSAGNALLVLTDQTMEPQNMNFALHFSDKTGTFNLASPSVAGQDAQVVDHPPFRIGWSGATTGKGYLYPTASPFGRARPADLKIYRTRTNVLSAVELDFDNTEYERIE